MSGDPRVRATEAASHALLADVTYRQGVGWVFGAAPAWLADRMVMAVLREVLALHTEYEGRCTHCLERCDCLDDFDEARVADCPHGNAEWPCPTIAAVGAP
jgi:hypothetical protein